MAPHRARDHSERRSITPILIVSLVLGNLAATASDAMNLGTLTSSSLYLTGIIAPIVLRDLLRKPRRSMDFNSERKYRVSRLPSAY